MASTTTYILITLIPTILSIRHICSWSWAASQLSPGNVQTIFLSLTYSAFHISSLINIYLVIQTWNFSHLNSQPTPVAPLQEDNVYGRVGESASQVLSIVYQKRLSNQSLSLHFRYLCLLVSSHTVNRYLFVTVYLVPLFLYFCVFGDSTV